MKNILAVFSQLLFFILMCSNHYYEIPFLSRASIQGGPMAKSDVLRAIKDAEISAASTIAKAKADAAKIVSDARAEAADLLKNSKVETNANSLSIIDAAKDEASAEASKVAKAGDAELKKLHASGDEHRKDAVNVILSSLNE